MRTPESSRYGLTACFIALTLLQSHFLSCSLRYDNDNKNRLVLELPDGREGGGFNLARNMIRRTD